MPWFLNRTTSLKIPRSHKQSMKKWVKRILRVPTVMEQPQQHTGSGCTKWSDSVGRPMRENCVVSVDLQKPERGDVKQKVLPLGLENMMRECAQITPRGAKFRTCGGQLSVPLHVPNVSRIRYRSRARRDIKACAAQGLDGTRSPVRASPLSLFFVAAIEPSCMASGASARCLHKNPW